MSEHIKGSIFELEISPSPVAAYGDVYISSLKKLYKIKLGIVSEIYDFEEDVLFSFLKGGLWINRGNVDGPKETMYVDIFGVGAVYPKTEFLVSSSAIDAKESFIVGFDYEADPSFLFVANISNLSIIKAIGKYYGFSFDGDKIFAVDVVKNWLFCFNLKLEPIWSIHLEGMDYGDWTKKPQLFGDLVLVNHAFNIIAFRKQDGQEVWRYKFDSSCDPTCCNLIGDRLYAECFGVGYVINPRNGGVIHEIPLGFLSSKKKQCVGIHFYPFQDKLVALSEHDGVVRVFSGDGTALLQELSCPREYKISSNTPPVITEDAIYQSVYSRTAVAGGVLILSVSGNELDSNIKIQSRPEIYITKQEEQGGKHAYNLYVDATDADTINRFGQISIKEIHFETGSEVYSDYLDYDGRDKQHNGKINFFVDPAQLSESEKERLESDLQKLEAYFSEVDCTAGDGTSAIKIEVLFKPKSEWDLSGEIVDLKQLREIRWENEPDEVEVGFS
ncbi:MAG: hypothetical protein L3J88_01040 [Gammaproteobacteria bacterium]|nr:hypothetical protein [Gammaproteobacteria bacterium]MCF6361953.1 hypothetical protein [Gammaproteobacteria bacterium]